MNIKNGQFVATLSLLVPFLSACAGSAGTSAVGPLESGGNVSGAVAQNVAQRNDHGCQNDGRDGGVSINPCFIEFTSSHPGPVSVTVRTGGGGGRGRGGGGGNNGQIREFDDCNAQNIASIKQESNGLYTVTAGTAIGSCDAQFSTGGNRNDDGNGGRGGRGGSGGDGDLRIVNQI
jgi:hypothetical protein